MSSNAVEARGHAVSPPRSSQLPAPWWSQWWFAICALGLIIASDYKYRVRPPGQALQGDVDAAIAIELAIYGMVAAYLVLGHLRSVRRLHLNALLTVLVVYVGLIGVSVLYTPFFVTGIVRAGQMLVLLILILSVVQDGTRAHLHRFAHAFVVLVAGSAVLGVVVPAEPVTPIVAGRFSWLAIHPTSAGTLAGLATVLAFGYLMNRDRERPGPQWSPWVYRGMFVLVAGALIGTQTRGAVLGALVGITVLLFTTRGGRAVIDLVLVAGLSVATVALVAGDYVAQYFQRGEDAEQLASLNSRTYLWSAAADAVAENPVFGVGTTAARGIFYDELGLGGGHNAVVNVAVELGLVGLACWSLLVVLTVVAAYRVPRSGPESLAVDRGFMLAVLAFLMVSGIFSEGAGAVTNVAALWFFVIVGWSVVAERAAEALEPPTASAVGRHRVR